MNTAMSLSNITPAQLRDAADLKEKIEALEQALSRLLGTPATTVSAVDTAEESPAIPGKRPRKKISAAGLARMRAAQQARWARARDAAPAAAPAKRGPKKMSPAARASIAAAQRARWAKLRGARVASI